MVHTTNLDIKLLNRVGAKDSQLAEWEKHTWPLLENLARSHPEAGIHFQRTYEQYPGTLFLD